MSLFNNKTEDEFRSREITTYLSSDCKQAKLSENDIIVFSNYERRALFGCCQVGLWEDGSVCRERHLLDDVAYSTGKYNGYEIRIKNVKFFEYSYDNMNYILDVKCKCYNTMTKGFNSSYRKAEMSCKCGESCSGGTLQKFKILLLGMM